MGEEKEERHGTDQDAILATVRRIQRQEHGRQPLFNKAGQRPHDFVRCRRCGTLRLTTDVRCPRCGADSVGFTMFRASWRILGDIILAVAIVLLIILWSVAQGCLAERRTGHAAEQTHSVFVAELMH